MLGFRPFSSSEHTAYRFGFNGKEKDDEVAGNGNQYDYGFRIYNPRVGRFLSVDPKADVMPWQSPYVSMDNDPALRTDPKGDCPICPELLRRAGAGLVAAGVETSVQFGIAMTEDGATWTSAIKKLDVFDIGVAFGEGVMTGGGNIPKILAKKAVVSTAGEVAKAGVDWEAGNNNGIEVVGIDKNPLDAGIELMAGKAAGKGSDRILGGMQEGLARDIKAGAFSTLNKAEKQTIRDLNKAASHEATTVTVGAIMDFGFGGAGEHSKGLFQAPALPSSGDNSMSAPADATGVSLPPMDFRPREKSR